MLIPQKISFTLFLTDGCQQIGYIMLIEKTKKRETKVSRFCTPSGARTLDPNIKSVVLYQLS